MVDNHRREGGDDNIMLDTLYDKKFRVCVVYIRYIIAHLVAFRCIYSYVSYLLPTCAMPSR